jgi:hypothetical protein
MGKINRPAAKGCAIVAAVVIGIPLLVAGVVGVKTWVPLQEAGRSLEELEQQLGERAVYIPAPSGAISPDRMEVFLRLRAALVTACDDYGSVRQGFDSVASLESKDPEDLGEVGDVAKDLGGASLAITPFLARFFESRNEALLAASMGLQEYAYIYAVAYHDQLLSDLTRQEIFSDGEALSPEASGLLRGCLLRQLESVESSHGLNPGSSALAAEAGAMADDPGRLLWQDSLPPAIAESVHPYCDQLDPLFCGATAGLEMERTAGRAVRVALE